ncbi:16S rRNA (cytosine(967)-C(5))-methyltransferase RsmB [Gynuella sp.]|uniref:16S rRNA (cytosine(967)-C(5))-methyltransferase RsmB n=1 Tax=Gynuella sp. TaxID=2969146 RepID=UPI003D14BE5C
MSSLREIIASTVATVTVDGRSLTDALNRAEQACEEDQLSALRHWCYESCRWYLKYQAVLDRLLKKKIKSKDEDIVCLMVLGLIQLDDPSTPDYAAISESVNCTVGLGKPWARGLVNAVLRQWQSKPEDLLADLANDIRYVSAHPGWLAKRLQKDWPVQAEAIMVAANQRAPMSLRVNLSQGSREDYLHKLQQEGIDGQLSSVVETGIKLIGAVSVQALPGFSAGTCSVQDEAAQLAAGLLELIPDHRVLDACCAPGGKTTHILEHGVTDLVAVDSDETRIERVKENLQRMQMSAQLVCADVSETEQWWDKQAFDRILLDVPCSATGVIRRHPDIRLLRAASDIQELVQIQRRMLQKLWQLLKPGGILLYSTCSILKAENQHNVEWFLEQTSDASLMPLPDLLMEYQGQLLPAVQGHDGFYYAKLKKSELE